MHKVVTLIRRKVQTGFLEVRVVYRCQGVNRVAHAEGETLMGKALYRGKGFTLIILRGLFRKTVVSERKKKELGYIT